MTLWVESTIGELISWTSTEVSRAPVWRSLRSLCQRVFGEHSIEQFPIASVMNDETSKRSLQRMLSRSPILPRGVLASNGSATVAGPAGTGAQSVELFAQLVMVNTISWTKNVPSWNFLFWKVQRQPCSWRHIGKSGEFPFECELYNAPLHRRTTRLCQHSVKHNENKLAN